MRFVKHYLSQRFDMWAVVILVPVIVVFVTFGFMWPKTRSLADEPGVNALVEKGRKISETVAGVGCKGCHGAYGEGDVGIGPYNRGVGLSKIKASIVGIKAMEFLKSELSPADIEAVAAYYSWLGSLQLVKTLVKRGRFIPDRIDIYPGTAVQFVIKNSSTASRQFASRNMAIKAFRVPGRKVKDFVWRAPVKQGTYELECLDCRLKGQKLTVRVSRQAKKYIIPPPSVPFAWKPVPSAPPAALAVKSIDMDAVAQGREIFLNAGEVGCVACHGPYGEGDVGIGPYNRGKNERAIRQALKTVEPMAFLKNQLSDDQIRQVAAYYEWLGQLKLVKTHVVKGRFFPDIINVAPGSKVQLVIINRGPSHIKLEAEGLPVKSYSIPGRGSQDRVWIAPRKEGEFALRCTDCTNRGGKLTIRITNAAR